MTRLQAMHHSGQLSTYIVSTLPMGNLATGWIEQGLLGKGFTGNIQDKEIQEELVIPIDRFTRLIEDYGTDINTGVFILGEHGLNKSKFVTLTGKSNSRKDTVTAIGFNSATIETLELLGIIERFISQKVETTISTDPNLDYVEDLLTDVANGSVTHLLSLSLQHGKQKPMNWIKKIMQTDLSSETVLAQAGNPQEISQFILLLSRWLLGLDLFGNTKNAIASILLVQDTQIVLWFWDQPQRIVTFAIIEGISVDRVLRKFVLPLWYTPPESSQESIGPKVVIEKTTKRQEITISDTKRKSDSTIPDSQSITIVRTRLTELNSRLSPIISHLNVLEKQITKIMKDSRFQSMSEQSDTAIEELRRIENETKILEDISTRLREMEKQIDTVTSSDSSSSSLSSDEIQKIVSKMAALRTLIDKIDVEIGQLDSRVSEIESLKFKRRT